MIVSHKYKFIFIHCPKTAGTSITEALVPILGEDDVVIFRGIPENPPNQNIDAYWNKETPVVVKPPILGKTPKYLYKHARADTIKHWIPPETWSSYFKFAVVRNPWERVVSWYYWWQVTNWDNPLGWGSQIKQMTFDEFVNSKIAEETAQYLSFSNTLCIDNMLAVDYVARMENLKENFAWICNRIGVKNITLPMSNTTKHKHYTEYYDEQTKEKVKQGYQKDINRFQYQYKA